MTLRPRSAGRDVFSRLSRAYGSSCLMDTSDGESGPRCYRRQQRMVPMRKKTKRPCGRDERVQDAPRANPPLVERVITLGRCCEDRGDKLSLREMRSPKNSGIPAQIGPRRWQRPRHCHRRSAASHTERAQAIAKDCLETATVRWMPCRAGKVVPHSGIERSHSRPW